MGSHLEQEARDRVVDRHQRAVALRGHFDGQLGRGAERVQHPGTARQPVWPDMLCQERRRHALRDGRQVARQGSVFFRFVSGDVYEIFHLMSVYRFAGKIQP